MLPGRLVMRCSGHIPLGCTGTKRKTQDMLEGQCFSTGLRTPVSGHFSVEPWGEGSLGLPAMLPYNFLWKKTDGWTNGYSFSVLWHSANRNTFGESNWPKISLVSLNFWGWEKNVCFYYYGVFQHLVSTVNRSIALPLSKNVTLFLKTSKSIFWMSFFYFVNVAVR